MPKHLVIVESPTKTKTIARILGSDYVVKSSVGHVRDLPQQRLGVNLERNFEPNYEISKGKAKVIEALRKAASGSDAIFLAPDPDREGEAIAWHLKALLDTKAQNAPFYRVQYNEITPRAVRDAFENPGQINMDRVYAQQARRILDRIVGYKVSPLLWRQIKRGLSAGRVQSVALRLVCEREQAILAFKPEPYWVMGAQVRKLIVPLDPFRIRLSRIDHKRAAIHDPQTAEAVLADLKNRPLRVSALKTRTVNRSAPPPFITSTLQQTASSALGFSPVRTMRLAQSLYEGFDFGQGAVGLITYMRTDSVNVSQDAVNAVRDYIQQTYGTDFLPPKPNRYRSRGSAQEAHEAIRPTDLTLTPQKLAKKLGAPERKLYTLIWNRFVASQMTQARIEYRIAEIDSIPEPPQQHHYRFSATAGEVAFPGFLRGLGTEKPPADTRKSGGNEPLEALPALREGEPLECIEWLSERKETSPPSRFSEAALVRALEANGVGRPSTYAGIVETLNDRKYVAREKRMLSPTPLGMKVCELLCAKLNALFDVGFTARMEADLDRIEAGELSWTDMLKQFYDQFERWIEAARTPPADPGRVQEALALLGQVRQWGPVRTQGKRTFSDEQFVTSIAEQANEGAKPVSQAQLEALLRLACRYKAQIPEAAKRLKQMGREDLLEAPELQPPRESTCRKLAWMQNFPLDDNDRQFVESLQSQVDAARRLSEAQIRVLDTLILAQAQIHQPHSLDKVCESLGIEPPDEAEQAENRQLLDALGNVSTWRESSQRGKRTFDDQAFVASLRDQFERRRTLSPRQRAALRRMVLRYRQQIPDFERLAAHWNLTEKPRKQDNDDTNS